MIVRKNDVFFKEFVEEPELFGNSDESVNSFRENQILFEIENNRLADNESASESFPLPSDLEPTSVSNAPACAFHATNSLPTARTPSDQERIDSDEIEPIKSGSHGSSKETKRLDSARERCLRALKNDNCILEQLLEDLELLKSVRTRTGRLNCEAKQLELVKRKLACFLSRQKNEQLDEAIFASDSGPLFRDNEECLRFVQCVLVNELELKIDDDCRLNTDLNLDLRLKLKNELMLAELLGGLNVRHDSRPTVKRCVEQFRAKLEPRLLSALEDLQRKFASVNRSMKITLNENDKLLRRFYELQEEKGILKLRYFTNEMRLIERFRMEIRQLHAGNLSMTNKINIAERAVKRLQNKI